MMVRCVMRTVLFLIVLALSHICVISISTKSLPWPNADKVINAVCPYTKICDVQPAQAGPTDQCCKKCICGNECATEDHDACCFRNNAKSEYESCMYLRSKSSNAYSFTPSELNTESYYVVTTPPVSGCHENKGNCFTSDLSSISPVYSRTTEKIYFNKECAICHGMDVVEDADFMFVCDDNGMPFSLNFDKEITKFLDGDPSSICFFKFQFPKVRILHRLCSINAVDSIDRLINITRRDRQQSYHNMSIEDIAKACVSSFYAPVLSASKQKLYPNPFCYLYGEGTHEKDICHTQTGNPSGYGFIALLNPEVIDIVRSEKKKQTIVQEEACLKTFDSRLFKYHSCRPVLCPLGHVLDNSGNCSYIGSRVMVQGRPNIYLYLILKNSEEMGSTEPNYANISIEYLTNAIQLPSEWKVALWGISAESDGSLKNGEILVILKLELPDVPKGITVLKSRLNKDVKILDKSFNISIYPQKLPLIKVIPINILGGIQCSEESKITGSQEIENDIPKCWKIIALNLYAYSAVFIDTLSKLYFCNLVQLKTGEFRLIANDTLLFYEIRGMYLFGNEFVVSTGEDGEKTVKICLDDSGLEKQGTSASFKSGLPILFEIGFLLFVSVTKW